MAPGVMIPACGAVKLRANHSPQGRRQIPNPRPSIPCARPISWFHHADGLGELWRRACSQHGERLLQAHCSHPLCGLCEANSGFRRNPALGLAPRHSRRPTKRHTCRFRTRLAWGQSLPDHFPPAQHPLRPTHIINTAGYLKTRMFDLQNGMPACPDHSSDWHNADFGPNRILMLGAE